MNEFSADVRMQLNVNGCVLPIAQLGPDFIILREPAAHPPSEAEVFMSIDGKESRWNVYLPHGIDGQSRTTTKTKGTP